MAPNNVNYQSILSQAQSYVNELTKLTDDDYSKLAGASDKAFVNSIWGITESAGQLISGNDAQKGNAIQNIISKLSDLMSSLGTNDSKAATKRALENEKKITANDNSAAKTSQTIDGMLNDIFSKCTAGAQSIENAFKAIQELGGDDDGLIAEAQEKLEEQLKIIEENKAVLNNESASNDDKTKALANILNASDEIASLVELVNGYTQQIEAQNTIVEEKSNEISELSVQATDILTDGIAEIKENIAKAGELVTENVQMSAESVQEKAAGTAQIATGEAMSNSVFTAAQGAKYVASGNDKVNAGATLMQASTKGLSELTKSVGTMGQYMSLFAGFTSGIGEFVNGVTELVGQYDTAVSPMIEAVGSWSVVAEQSAELDTYTQTYAAESGVEVSEGKDEQGQEQKTVAANEKTSFKKFEFDTTGFGI